MPADVAITSLIAPRHRAIEDDDDVTSKRRPHHLPLPLCLYSVMTVLLFCLPVILCTDSQQDAYLTISCPHDAKGRTERIIEGQPVNCTCRLVDPSESGGQQGVVQWIDPNWDVVAEGSGEATISIDYDQYGSRECEYPTSDVLYPKGRECFFATDNLRDNTWARKDCRYRAWGLARIPDADAARFLAMPETREKLGISYKTLWVDGVVKSNSRWFGSGTTNPAPWSMVWSNKKPVTYFNWAHWQPSKGRMEKCLEIYWSSSQKEFLFNDQDCDKERVALCSGRTKVRDNNDSEYKCQAVTVTNKTISKTIVTRFASGPHLVYVSALRYNGSKWNFTYNLEDDPEVTLYCSMDERTTHPSDPKVTIEGVLPRPILHYDKSRYLATYRFEFRFKPGAPGVFEAAECVAANSHPGGMTVRKNFTLNLLGCTQVALGDDCPGVGANSSAFIPEGRSGQCSCLVNAPGNPNHPAQWLDDLGNVVDSDPEVAKINLTGKTDRRYICTAACPVGAARRKEFFAQFAIGPKLYHQDTRLPVQATVQSDGNVYLDVDVISNPRPTTYRLTRKSDSVDGGTDLVFPRYVIKVRQVKKGHQQFKLSLTFPALMHPRVNQYIFTVETGEATLDIPVQTSLRDDNSYRALPARVESLTVNRQSGMLVVKKGQQVDIRCTGGGHLKPSLSLRGQRCPRPLPLQGHVIPSSSFVAEGRYRTTVGCMDSDIFTCFAENERGRGNQTVTVLAACPLSSLADSSSTSGPRQEYEACVNRSLTVSFSLGGLDTDPPKSLVLTKGGRVLYPPWATSRPESRRFSAATLFWHPSKLVAIFMENLQLEDSGQYVLTMRMSDDDDPQRELDYTFDLTVADWTPCCETTGEGGGVGGGDVDSRTGPGSGSNSAVYSTVTIVTSSLLLTSLLTCTVLV